VNGISLGTMESNCTSFLVDLSKNESILRINIARDATAIRFISFETSLKRNFTKGAQTNGMFVEKISFKPEKPLLAIWGSSFSSNIY
jgi:hypothetical protein